MKTKTNSDLASSVAATVAGEDLARGDYVAVLTETVEAPSYLWDCCGFSLSPHELVRLRMIPADAGQPLKVVAVCLPFVYAKTPKGKAATIDIRRIRLARLDRECAKAVWKFLQAKRKKKN